MSKLVKKIILSFLSFAIVFLSLVPRTSPVVAATDASWYNQGFVDWYHKVYDDGNQNEIFGERYTAAQVQWVVYSLISLPLNMDPDTQKVIACLFGTVGGSTDISTCSSVLLSKFQKMNSYFESLGKETANKVNEKTSLASMVFDSTDRPISGIRYLSNFVGRLSPVKSAYAQGYGYTQLDPIQKYWSGFRNIAYSLIVFVVIVFAFMIMFRVKLSPQLVISVQVALPKIIVAILLTTFSYAISGFMIDLMYVVGGLFASLLVTAGFAESITGTFGTYNTIFPSNVTGFYFLTHMVVYDLFFLISVAWNFVAGLNTVSGIFASTILAIVGILLVVWILILSIWYTFKATWVLIKTLINVYISIITSPIQFTLGALVPSFSFGNWFKRLLSDLLVFPVTGVVMFFAWNLMWTSYRFGSEKLIVAQIIEFIKTWSGGNASWFSAPWAPEIIGVGESVTGFLFLFASFACIALIPKIPDMLKGFILGEKFSFGTAIGEAAGPLSWTWNQTGGSLFESLKRSTGEKTVKELSDKLSNYINGLLPKKKGGQVS